jgi:hypothetical protein
MCAVRELIRCELVSFKMPQTLVDDGRLTLMDLSNFMSSSYLW